MFNQEKPKDSFDPRKNALVIIMAVEFALVLVFQKRKDAI